LPKVLLVDDDEELQKILKSVLEKEGFEVQTANNGNSAKTLVALESFEAVISDINMPGSGVGGIELLEYIQSSHPGTPVILMTGFAKVFETKDAFDLGARAFLAKPFKREELVLALRNDCGIGAPAMLLEKGADASADFCKIAIDQFISGRIIKFEIFVRLGDSKYTKIAHEGEDVALDRVLAFKGKGVEFLYVKKEDFAKYVGFNLTLSRAVKNSKTIPHEKKILLARHASEVIMENLFVNGVDEEGFEQAKEITETTLGLLSESPQCFDLLAALSANGDPLYTHSLGVSLFGAMIARQIGWGSPVTLFKVSTAGLLHDIGLKEIDSAITGKQRSSLSHEEVMLLESHPARSARILGSIPSIPSDILQIVLHHHESCAGHGYPSNLSRSKINPMAKLISVADEFCELAIAGPNSPGIPARDAIERLGMVNADALDPEFMKALKAVLRK